MAASLTFAADFSNFSQALDRATLQLKTFGLEPAKVEKALNRIGDSFSGTKIISDATLATRAIQDMGGVSKLTADEQKRLNAIVSEAIAKYQALGQTAPQELLDVEKATRKVDAATGGMTKQLTLAERAAGLAKSTFGQMFGAFSAVNLLDKAVSSLINFGKEAVNSAGRIVDLSAKLNVSTDAIQRWEFVAKQTGATLEDFSSNAFKLGTRLSTGGDSVKKAVDDLGLSFEQLSRLKPEAQFETVVSSLGEMQDATKRNAIGVALFGRGFESIASAVAQGYKRIADGATLSTNQQLVALDKAGDAWDAFLDRQKKNVQGFLGNLVTMAEAQRKFEAQVAKDPKALGALLNDLPAGASNQEILDAIRKRTAFIGPMPIQGAGLTPVIDDTDDAIKALGVTFHETTKAVVEMKTPLLDVKASMLSLATAAPQLVRSLDEGVPILASWNKITAKQTLDLKLEENALYALPPAIKSVGVEIEKAAEKSGLLSRLFKGLTGAEGLGGILNKVGTGIFEGFGNLISGGLTSLISGGISLLGKGIGALFGKLTGGEGKKVNDLRDAAFAAAGGFDKLNQQAHLAGVSLEKVLSTKKVKDYEAAWKDLQGTLDEYTADQELLNQALEEFGFTFEERGPALQFKELNDQALALTDKWRVLVAAGVDIEAVNTRMAKSVQEYLTTALKVGLEIPAAMRPILESMRDQGTLVDENGVAITDFEAKGIKFSQTMTEGFDRVVKKLDELIVKLYGAGKAIADIPSTVEVGVQYRDSGVPVWQGEPQDLPAFASGTRGRFLDFGSGTPVLLHGRERVMTESERKEGGGALESIASALDGIDRRISTAVSRAVTDALILAPGWR